MLDDTTGHMSALHWIILAVSLLGTTLLGHLLRGKAGGLEGFYLGNRSLPWWAVAGSLIATRTSALIFISVPAVVYAQGGDLRYVQAVLGFILGDILMAALFIRKFYEGRIFSPFDYFARKLGPAEGNLARGLWLVSAVLSQGVRLLATALVLSVITDLHIATCIAIIAVFAVLWSILGGITTVIWTDVIQLLIFLSGAVFSVIWMISSIDGGLSEILRIGSEEDKLRWLDFSIDPRLLYTVWVGLIAATVFQLSQLCSDQIYVQRILCCSSVKEARKAILGAIAGNVTTFLMLFVGLALYAFYQIHAPAPADAAMLASEPDRAFPFFLVTELPPIAGAIIITAIFAAGITTLDSALTAVSETTINGLYSKYLRPNRDDRHYMRASRIVIAGWGVVFAIMAYGMYMFATEGLLALGLSVFGYVYGALLGIALLSFWGVRSNYGVYIGTAASILLVIGLQTAGVAFFWWYPAGVSIFLAVALGFDRFRKAAELSARQTSQ